MSGPCDNCESNCQELHGDSDRAMFCCLCMARARRPYIPGVPEMCRPCELRLWADLLMHAHAVDSLTADLRARLDKAMDRLDVLPSPALE
jgi:hypothetical protein